jgi:hypothetical protein
MFRLPFRQELYRKRMESVHAQDWIAYKALSPEQKNAFFDEKQRSGIHAYLDSTKEFITFDIPNVAIVHELIGNLFFKPELDEDDEETEPISKANALKLFRPIFDRDEDDMEDGAANDEADRFVRRYAVTNTTMTGRTGSVVTLLERQCTNPVLRVWCVPHQLDLVVKTATAGVDDGEFYKAAHALSVHL